jgi:hypothetical protein
MGVACIMHGMDEKFIQLVGHFEGNVKSEDLYGRIILYNITVTRLLLTPDVQCWGYFITSDHQLYVLLH